MVPAPFFGGFQYIVNGLKPVIPLISKIWLSFMMIYFLDSLLAVDFNIFF